MVELLENSAVIVLAVAFACAFLATCWLAIRIVFAFIRYVVVPAVTYGAIGLGIILAGSAFLRQQATLNSAALQNAIT